MPQGRDNQVGTWPEFNKLIGGFFKFHWADPQLITVKIDDPKSPLTAMFHGQEFDIHDETYTFAHGLLVAQESPRPDQHRLRQDERRRQGEGRLIRARIDDYALSWIRREGKGRVFYEGHGHSERVYAMTPMLEHLLAGMQYAIGDLKADDAPSKK